MVNFLPKTKPGKLSAIFIIAFFLFFAALRLLVGLGEQGGAGFFSNPLLAAAGILAAIFGIAAFFAGIFAIARKKERAVLVFLAALAGLLILLFVLGEIFSPH